MMCIEIILLPCIMHVNIQIFYKIKSLTTKGNIIHNINIMFSERLNLSQNRIDVRNSKISL